ncbi:MAG: hypothetical protein AAGA09_06010 [Pseudomonadota bacterium]
MLDPANDPGVQYFAIANITLVVCAGIASFPPARHFRVFVAAVAELGFFVAAVFVRKDHPIESSFLVAFDAGLLYLYYQLSKPELAPNGEVIHTHDWADYLCFGLGITIVYEFIDILIIAEFAGKGAFFIGALLFAAIFAYGFMRGFGFLAFGAFVLALALLSTLAYRYFSITHNLMGLVTKSIILAAAVPAMLENLDAFARFVGIYPPKGDDNAEAE